jgi:hypothetical protein
MPNELILAARAAITSKSPDKIIGLKGIQNSVL